MMPWPSRILAAGAIAGLPLAAQAECLGGGCYNGLGILIGLALGAVLLAIVVVVLLVMRRWTAAKIAGGLLACAVIGVFVLFD
jgi:hypothetical protein